MDMGCERLLLTVPQVMDCTQLGRHKIYELINTRRLVSVLIGRSRRIPVSAVQDLLQDLIDRGGC
jgi:excisionase family DNA binding protein